MVTTKLSFGEFCVCSTEKLNSAAVFTKILILKIDLKTELRAIH